MWNDIRDMEIDSQEGDCRPPMAPLVECRTTMRKGVGSNPGQTTTQGLDTSRKEHGHPGVVLCFVLLVNNNWLQTDTLDRDNLWYPSVLFIHLNGIKLI